MEVIVKLKDEFEWRNAWEESWKLAAQPNPHCLTDNALKLLRWLQSGKYDGKTIDVNMLGKRANLRGSYHHLSEYLTEIQVKADPDIANADGLTAIQLAERKDRSHLASLMEAHIDKKLSVEATQTGIEPLYTVRKVAELLSVDDPFVLELIKSRKITGLSLDAKTLRITAGSVQRYLTKLARK